MEIVHRKKYLGRTAMALTWTLKTFFKSIWKPTAIDS